MQRLLLALSFACVLAFCNSSIAREKIWTSEVPIGEPQKIDAYLASVSAALPAGEQRILSTGLRWLDEWCAGNNPAKAPRRATLEWLQGRCLLDAILVGYAKHSARVQNSIDDFYKRRQATLAQLADVTLSREQRTALEKTSAELQANLAAFVHERDSSEGELDPIMPRVIVATPETPLSAPPLSSPAP